mgnify:FL=1
MKMTLIELVKDILSDLESDTVDSYTDTVESQQVAQILQTTYFNLIDGRDWPHLYSFFKLESNTGSGLRPTHFTLPDNVMDVKYIKYNCEDPVTTRDNFKVMKFMEPLEFMDMLQARDSEADNVQVVTGNSGTKYNIIDNKHPTYYTTLGETSIIFDSYNDFFDDQMLDSNTQCYGKIYPTVTLADSMYFNLPVDAFSMLLSEAKAVASITLKQVANPKAEQHSQTQRRRMSQEAWKIQERTAIHYNNYGRLGKK